MVEQNQGMGHFEVLDRLNRLENCLGLILGVKPPQPAQPAQSPQRPQTPQPVSTASSLPATELYYEFPDEPGPNGREEEVMDRLSQVEGLMAQALETVAPRERDGVDGTERKPGCTFEKAMAIR